MRRGGASLMTWNSGLGNDDGGGGGESWELLSVIWSARRRLGRYEAPLLLASLFRVSWLQLHGARVYTRVLMSSSRGNSRY